MKTTIILSLIALAAAQDSPYTLNNNGTISCRELGGFCAGDSGKTNIIVHCQQIGSVGNYAGNCNDNLAGACGGVCEFAPCRQTSPTTGDGQCSLEGAIASNGTTLHEPTPTQTPAAKRSVFFKS